jgi:hypothetical protein
MEALKFPRFAGLAAGHAFNMPACEKLCHVDFCGRFRHLFHGLSEFS